MSRPSPTNSGNGSRRSFDGRRHRIVGGVLLVLFHLAALHPAIQPVLPRLYCRDIFFDTRPGNRSPGTVLDYPALHRLHIELHPPLLPADSVGSEPESPAGQQSWRPQDAIRGSHTPGPPVHLPEHSPVISGQVS